MSKQSKIELNSAVKKQFAVVFDTLNSAPISVCVAGRDALRYIANVHAAQEHVEKAASRLAILTADSTATSKQLQGAAADVARAIAALIDARAALP